MDSKLITNEWQVDTLDAYLLWGEGRILVKDFFFLDLEFTIGFFHSSLVNNEILVS